MKTNRRTAVLVGIFFIIGAVSGALSMINLGPFLEDQDYLANIAASTGYCSQLCPRQLAV